MPAKPLTVTEVRALLDALVADKPEIANWPVHVLDMDDEENEEFSCLVTHVEIDRFSREQPWVVSLMAWRSRDEDLPDTEPKRA